MYRGDPWSVPRFRLMLTRMPRRYPTLKPVPVSIPLTSMTMHDGIDRGRPVASRDIVTHEGELKPAAAEQSSGLKRRGKSESTT